MKHPLTHRVISNVHHVTSDIKSNEIGGERGLLLHGRSGIAWSTHVVSPVCASLSFKATSKLQRAHACPCRLRGSPKAARSKKPNRVRGLQHRNERTARNTHRHVHLLERSSSMNTKLSLGVRSQSGLFPEARTGPRVQRCMCAASRWPAGASKLGVQLLLCICLARALWPGEPSPRAFSRALGRPHLRELGPQQRASLVHACSYLTSAYAAVYLFNSAKRQQGSKAFRVPVSATGVGHCRALPSFLQVITAYAASSSCRDLCSGP